MLKKYLVYATLLCLAAPLLAQHRPTNLSAPNPPAKTDRYRATSSIARTSASRPPSTYETYEPVQVWSFAENPDPKLNFPPPVLASPSATSTGAGGPTSPSKLPPTPNHARDERTTDLADVADKAAIYFGGNFTAAYDQFFYTGTLFPVGDVNGDGYGDATVGEKQSSQEYYMGSPGGYVPTGVTEKDLSASNRGRTVGFVDFDGDGFGDYVNFNSNHVSETGTSFQVYWGAAAPDGIEAKVYASEAADYVTIQVADLESDGAPELVVLHGQRTFEGSGGVLVYEFTAEREPVLRERIRFPEDVIGTGRYGWIGAYALHLSQLKLDLLWLHRKVVIALARLLLLDVGRYRLIGHVARRSTEVPSRPQMTTPEPTLEPSVLVQELVARLALELLHQLRDRKLRRHRDQQMHSRCTADARDPSRDGL